MSRTSHYNVVIVGSCNYDFFNFVERFPLIGETLNSSKFFTALGGKGANQAVQCAKLGANVAMVGKVGKDAFGQEIKANFESEKVNCDFVTLADEQPTGTATIVVSKKDGKNFIIINTGANGALDVNDIEICENLIKSCTVLVCQLEVPVEVVCESFKVAKKYKVTTIFNPAPALRNLPQKIFDNVDIVCPNEVEAEILTEIKPDSSENIKLCLEHLLKLNVNIRLAIITMGERGCYFSIREQFDCVRHVTIEKFQAIDTTGAGDSFVGALAFYTALFPDMNDEEKIRRSCLVASKSVLKQGAQPSYWNKDALDPALFL